jgi:hypothetical protein
MTETEFRGYVARFKREMVESIRVLEDADRDIAGVIMKFDAGRWH